MRRIAPIALRGDRRGRSPFAGAAADSTRAASVSARLPGRSECLIPKHRPRAREDAAPRRPSRNRGPGSVKIAGHVSQAVHRQLRMLGATQGRPVQALLGEALNELFRKHGQRPIAGE